MASILENLKILRERTGVGILECKKALNEAANNIEDAIDALRKSGQAKAVKKSTRIAAEGKIAVKSNDDFASIIEVNCETDFVAKDKNFLDFSESLLDLIDNDIDLSNLDNIEIGGKAVSEIKAELVSKVGENIQIRRPLVVTSNDGSKFVSYSHGGRIGVIVEYKGDKNDKIANDVAMQVAAMNPSAISMEDIPKDVVEKEKEIATHKLKDLDTPEEFYERRLNSQVNKVLKAMTLLDQNSIIDPDSKVSSILKENKMEIINFIRYEVGEGIEKKQDNFVEEVMSQVK
jgi:elongation factor Ts